MKIVVSLLLIISVATFFSVGNASPAVSGTYNPAKVSQESKMSKWAVGQTQTLNFTLVDPNTATGIDIYECYSYTISASTRSSRCLKLTTLAAKVTTYDWKIDKTGLKQFNPFSSSPRYLLFYPEGSTSYSNDRFYTGYKLYDETQITSITSSWIQGYNPEVFEGSTHNFEFEVDPELPNQKYVIYDCKQNKYSTAEANDCRTLTKNENNGVVPSSTSGNSRTISSITIPSNTVDSSSSSYRYIIIYAANTDNRLYKRYKAVSKQGSIYVYINDKQDGTDLELCDDGSGGSHYSYKIKWTSGSGDSQTTYKPESVTFYQCHTRVVSNLDKCLKIGESNSDEEINYVPTVERANNMVSSRSSESSKSFTPIYINYIMSGTDNVMKNIGSWTIYAMGKNDEKCPAPDTTFSTLILLLIFIITVNELLKLYLHYTAMKDYNGEAFKYWNGGTTNPMHQEKDEISAALVGEALKTTQGKDTIVNIELAFSKCPRCSKNVKKPPGILVFQCLQCGAMLTQSKDGTKYVEAEAKREKDERYRFDTEAITAIQRTVQQVINIFSYNVNQILQDVELKVTTQTTNGHRAGDISSMGRRARGNNFARVYDTANRAGITRRNYAAIIDGGQQTGKNGKDGINGRNGASGMTGGYGGGNGGQGQNGTPGMRGGDATPSSAAKDLNLNVNGNDSGTKVNVAGRDYNLPPNGKILIDTHGGDGGHGGRGGKGGHGGRGGMGGAGRDGSNGHNASGAGQNGGRGGDGGRGGNGGNGGNGAGGGDSGNSTDGSNAGKITLTLTNLRHLAIFEFDARKGIGGRQQGPGAGGAGGSGGSGGRGGRGGSGGSGGPARRDKDGKITTSAGSRGSNGSTGPSGSSGRSGSRGQNGRAGRNGRDGNNGTVTIICGGEKGSDRFNVTVSEYYLLDENSDTIMEPNTTFAMKKIVFKNDGDFTLPDGSICTGRSYSPALKVISQPIKQLPLVKKGTIGKVDGVVQFQIQDAPISLNQPHVSEVVLSPSITMIGRLFEDSEMKAVVRVMYPTRVTNFNPPELLGPNEKSILNIAIKNISTKPYGENTKTGKVEIELSTDQLMTFLQPNGTGVGYAWKVINSQKCIVTFTEIAAKSEVVAQIPIKTTRAAGNNLFKDSSIEGLLKLRGKPISRYTRKIRIVPVFDASKAYDVLLITSNKIDRKNFLAWQYLFNLCGLQNSAWDIGRYKRLTAAAQLSWVGRAAHVILPCFKGVIGAKDLYHQDVETHFAFQNTSIIVIGGDSKDLSHLRFDYLNPKTPQQIGYIACGPCITPSCRGQVACLSNAETETKSVISAAMLYNKLLQKQSPQGVTHQAVVDFNMPRRAYTKSCFGMHLDGVEFYESILPAHSQLICVNNGDNEGTLSVAELPFSTQVLDGVTSFIPSGKPIDLSTPWGLAFVSLLSAQPAWIKCRYISRNDFLSNMKFVSPEYIAPGVIDCCNKKVPAVNVNFKWLMLSLLRDTCERALVDAKASKFKEKADGIAVYDSIRLYFESLGPEARTNPIVKATAANIIAALISARNSTTAFINKCPCVSGLTASSKELKKLNESFKKMEAVLGDGLVALAGRIANRIEPRQKLIPNARLRYPCTDPDPSDDVIHYEDAKEFNKLNKRICSIPVGEVLVEATVTHPLLYVSATAVALPVWDAVAWTPPDGYQVPVVDAIKPDDAMTGFSKD